MQSQSPVVLRVSPVALRPVLHSILQALQNEVVSQASLYSNLLQLKEALFSAASKEDVAMMKLQLEQLDERWDDLPQIISKRLLVAHKGASNNVPWTTRVNIVLCLSLFNVAVQGLVLKEMRLTLSVMFESRASLRSEQEVV